MVLSEMPDSNNTSAQFGHSPVWLEYDESHNHVIVERPDIDRSTGPQVLTDHSFTELVEFDFASRVSPITEIPASSA